MPHDARTRRPLFGLLVAVTAILALAAPALADHQPAKLGLTPVGESGLFFDLTMEPGEIRQLRVEVANFGHDDLSSRTFAADGYTIINGGFGAKLFDEPVSGTTLWLEYPTEELTLGPAESLAVDFRVSVPVGTPSGEYITALVAENVEPFRGQDEGDVVIEQVNRTVVAVAIEVPGQRRPALEIGAVGHKDAAGLSFISFEIMNEGNRHLKPSGNFSLQDATGTVLASAASVMDSVYAGTDTLLEAPLSETLRPGAYCAELALTDEETGVTASTECLAFTVAAPVVEDVRGGEGSRTIPVLQPALDAVSGDPFLAVLGALAGLLLLVALYLVLRRRRRRSESPQPA